MKSIENKKIENKKKSQRKKIESPILNKKRLKLPENLPNSAEEITSNQNLKKKVHLIRDMFEKSEKSDHFDVILPLKGRNVDLKSASSQMPNLCKSPSKIFEKERKVSGEKGFIKQQTLKNYFFKEKVLDPKQKSSIGQRNLDLDDLPNRKKV